MENFTPKADRSYILSVLSSPTAHVHMVGILGAGMMPLAILLKSRGITVSGTDIAGGERADALRCLGITVLSYHSARDVVGADLVVFSLAAPEKCAELTCAARLGIPTVTRAELLGAIMSLYPRSVTVSGTHGKSTTVGMLDMIFCDARLDHTAISGAELASGTALREGNGEIILAEACEYKRAFHHLNPTLALITNIELDHTDCYPTLEAVYDAYLTFARGAETVVLNTDCPLSRRLSGEGGINPVTYGTRDADVTLLYADGRADGTDFLVRFGGAVYDFHIPVIGRGNLYDALGAIAVSHALGLHVSNIKAALSVFSGICRRLEPIGILEGRAVYYDYAHHPTEIENTLAALFVRHPRISVIFRPHTYSRTAALMDDFATVLRAASDTVVLDIYPAREEPIEGVTAAALAERIGESAVWLPDSLALEYILDRPSDAIVLMGAGDMSAVLGELAKYK